MNNFKVVSVDKLQETIDDLPKYYKVLTNNLGNLVVLGANNEYIGYIDFSTGEFEVQ